MRALVTGAAGLIGSNLALELARRGHAVTALDDFSCGKSDNLRDFTGDVVCGDAGDSASWQAAVGQVDAVFHQAAITDTTVTDQAKMMAVNVEAFRRLLQWSARMGVGSVVYASSAAIYGVQPVPMRESARPNPMNVYAFSKRVMERVALDFAAAHKKTKVVGLRYFNVYGTGEEHKGKAASMIWQLYKQMSAGLRPRIFEFGDQYRDFIYVKDVVEANVLAAEKASGGVFNVCTGQKTTFNRVIEVLNSVMGTKLAPDYFKNPYVGAYQDETLGDPSEAEAAFGFKAKFSPAAGIEDYLGGRKVEAGV